MGTDDNHHGGRALLHAVAAGGALPEDILGAVTQLAGRLDLRSLERLYILQTLALVNGSRKAAVERLGISERTLRNKLQLYRLQNAG